MIGVFVSCILFTIAMVVLLTFATITFKGIVAHNSAKCSRIQNLTEEEIQVELMEQEPVETDIFKTKQLNITQRLINTRSLLRLYDCSQILKDRIHTRYPTGVYKLR